MGNQLTEDVIGAVLEQIKSSPIPLAAGEISGTREASLLAIRELRRRGMIDGVFLDDSTRPGDEHGPYLYDAARLTAY